MRVVILGVSGFLGQHLAQSLKATAEVVGVSRKHSFQTTHIVDDYAQSPDGDVLIHLAENANRNSVNGYSDAEVREATSLLPKLAKKSFQHIIYASSAVLYGDQSEASFDENSPIYAQDIYAQIKVANEQNVLCQDGTVLRLANILGPNMSSANVVSDIIKQLNNDTSVTVQNWWPIRDFISVYDVVTAITKVIDMRCKGLYNVGSGSGTSIKQIAFKILELAKKSELSVTSLQQQETFSCNFLNIEKLKHSAGWQPRQTLHETLAEIVSMKRD